MTMKSWLGVIGVGMLTLNIGCARETPLSPSEVNDAVSGTQVSELTTTSTPVVTLKSDLTASPSSVTVAPGYRVLMINESPRTLRMHSYDCSEFTVIYLEPGRSRHTLAFDRRKTCNYFVWDTGWSRKIFEGKVTVQ